ncbi:MAG: DUF1684 domain-containing protein [candidate division KSB1 bacterium]|nr:DUF1684 domain-containing protein [candidate division KSB1 bacterium]
MRHLLYFVSGCLLLFGNAACTKAQQNQAAIVQAIDQQRREKDIAFKNSSSSPLPEKDKKNFHGLPYFPVDLKFRFEGPIYRYAQRETFEMIASNGARRKTLRYGYFEFQLDDKKYRLQVYKLLDLPHQYSHLLFVPFTDATSGRESYGGGRYIDLEERQDNSYVVDFNLAYNPSCAYGREDYSCPIPPKENHLPVRIEAGEKKWAH